MVTKKKAILVALVLVGLVGVAYASLMVVFTVFSTSFANSSAIFTPLQKNEKAAI
jgi:hypothetical protein